MNDVDIFLACCVQTNYSSIKLSFYKNGYIDTDYLYLSKYNNMLLVVFNWICLLYWLLPTLCL